MYQVNKLLLLMMLVVGFGQTSKFGKIKPHLLLNLTKYSYSIEELYDLYRGAPKMRPLIGKIVEKMFDEKICSNTSCTLEEIYDLYKMTPTEMRARIDYNIENMLNKYGEDSIWVYWKVMPLHDLKKFQPYMNLKPYMNNLASALNKVEDFRIEDSFLYQLKHGPCILYLTYAPHSKIYRAISEYYEYQRSMLNLIESQRLIQFIPIDKFQIQFIPIDTYKYVRSNLINALFNKVWRKLELWTDDVFVSRKNHLNFQKDFAIPPDLEVTNIRPSRERSNELIITLLKPKSACSTEINVKVERTKIEVKFWFYNAKFPDEKRGSKSKPVEDMRDVKRWMPEEKSCIII